MRMTMFSAGSASQQPSGNLQSQSVSAANGTQEQMQQAQQQSDNQQYSEADWAAYWQYYGKSPIAARPSTHACAAVPSMVCWQCGKNFGAAGHTAMPPPPPPPLQLCPKHMQLLEQLCASQGRLPHPRAMHLPTSASFLIGRLPLYKQLTAVSCTMTCECFLCWHVITMCTELSCCG